MEQQVSASSPLLIPGVGCGLPPLNLIRNEKASYLLDRSVRNKKGSHKRQGQQLQKLHAIRRLEGVYSQSCAGVVEAVAIPAIWVGSAAAFGEEILPPHPQKSRPA